MVSSSVKHHARNWVGRDETWRTLCATRTKRPFWPKPTTTAESIKHVDTMISHDAFMPERAWLASRCTKINLHIRGSWASCRTFRVFWAVCGKAPHAPYASLNTALQCFSSARNSINFKISLLLPFFQVLVFTRRTNSTWVLVYGKVPHRRVTVVLVRSAPHSSHSSHFLWHPSSKSICGARQ